MKWAVITTNGDVAKTAAAANKTPGSASEETTRDTAQQEQEDERAKRHHTCGRHGPLRVGGEASDRGDRQQRAGEAAPDEAEPVVDQPVGFGEVVGVSDGAGHGDGHGPRDQDEPGPPLESAHA